MLSGGIAEIRVAPIRVPTVADNKAAISLVTHDRNGVSTAIRNGHVRIQFAMCRGGVVPSAVSTRLLTRAFLVTIGALFL